MSTPEFNPHALDNRRILRGVQCVCGQWWPDYVLRDGIAHMECCGSRYQLQSGEGTLTTLSLLEDARHPAPPLPEATPPASLATTFAPLLQHTTPGLHHSSAPGL